MAEPRISAAELAKVIVAELITKVSPEEATKLLLEATYRFTEPQLVQQMLAEDREGHLDALVAALMRGFGSA